MKNIVAVGFDMDYTSARYILETFESLAYEGTVKKVGERFGIPFPVAALDVGLNIHGLGLGRENLPGAPAFDMRTH
ncbi:HAD-superfamily hydrolase, subfamily IG, 5'-nucleotidase [Dillenia turbinata]|uniref:HAD-superfamily hydrolase, subfamily IG, 5'-nucleotidase n=1 Tax=Dillenia turbinata TaxID=194707 RepID=A0AAN8W5M3_9MAGN